jgi:dimethylargininase
MEVRVVLTHAIARTPGRNFAEGLTSAGLGAPDFVKALEQHGRYCQALERRGLRVSVLEADLRYPDSTFVEDTAVLVGPRAIITRPGAVSRRPEAAEIRPVLSPLFKTLNEIVDPGTLDGGDICEAGNHFFIGLSHRTNEEGARQLSGFLAAEGATSSSIDIREMRGVLHLKSGLSYLGDRCLVAIKELSRNAQFRDYDVIEVEPDESYASCCLRVNDRVLLAAGFPRLEASLRRRGLAVETIDVSEFQKMDGGLTCLSLRF